MTATIDVEGLLAFRAVAEAGGFSAAARRRGMDKAQVSRAVSRLEGAMGAALFVRTTRSVRLTPEGEQLLREAGPHLAGLQQALRVATDRAAPLVGEVSITTTPDLGRALLAPALASFRPRFPGLQVRVVLSHEVVDLANAGVDLALRVGRPGPGSHLARKLGEVEAGFYASPGYLARRGTPRDRAELSSHDGLWPMPPPGQRAFRGEEKRPPPPAVDCADFAFLAAVARSGGGVALLPTFLAAEDVHAGRLSRLLPDVRLGGAPLYLVQRPERPVAPRVAALRAHLVEAMRHGVP